MVTEGYADLVSEQIAAALITDSARIQEALRRHQVERGEAGRFVEGMLGVELDRSHYERGQAFCAGVVERAGMGGLNRLWSPTGDAADPERARRPRPLAGAHRPPGGVSAVTTRRNR